MTDESPIPEIGLFRVSLKAIFRNRSGKYLLLRNPETSAGKFDLPGGRINQEEAELEIGMILSREIREEIGREDFTLEHAPIGCGVGISKTGFPTVYVIFKGLLEENGGILLSDEHSDYEWAEEIPETGYANEGLNRAVRNAKLKLSDPLIA